MGPVGQIGLTGHFLYPFSIGLLIKEFINEKVINKSEHIGILYWLDDDEKKFVEDFENEHNAVVYHIIKTYTTIGCMLSVFYVSDDEAEWESDREDMKIGEQLCYVKNIDNDDCSEFGYICFQKNCGGLMRTAWFQKQTPMLCPITGRATEIFTKEFSHE